MGNRMYDYWKRQPEVLRQILGQRKAQTEEFVNEVINPILEENKEVLGLTAEINV